MTPVLFIAVALAGGLGAVVRSVVDGLVSARRRADVPWGIVAINITGSMALGVVVGVAAGLGSDPVVAVVGIGFLGGYTTFSTASVATVRLISRRLWVAALVTGPGMLIASVAAAAVGWMFGGLIR